MLTRKRGSFPITSVLGLFLVGCQASSDIEANNEEVVREALAAIDAQNFGHLTELFSEDFVVRFVGSPDRVGRDVTFELIRGAYASFPDQTHIVEEIISEGDRVAVRLRYQGTHQGEFDGISPTGQQFDYGCLRRSRYPSSPAGRWSGPPTPSAKYSSAWCTSSTYDERTLAEPEKLH